MRAVRNTIVVVSVIGAVALGAACSSSSSSGGSEADAGGAEVSSTVDVAVDVVNNPDNCVKPGTPNNAQGIGGYCNPGGGQCAKAGPGGSPTICTGDTANVTNAWFCTVPCPSMCGAGATCMTTPSGAECVPTSCAGYFPDASSTADGGSDATGMDAGHGDAGPSDAGGDGSSLGDGAVGD
jgi:hypothetical protein